MTTQPHRTPIALTEDGSLTLDTAGWYLTYYRKVTRQPGKSDITTTVGYERVIRDLTVNLRDHREALSAETDGRNVWIKLPEGQSPFDSTYTRIDTAAEFLQLALEDAKIVSCRGGDLSAAVYWVEVQTPAGGVIRVTGRGDREGQISYLPSEHRGWAVTHIPDPASPDKTETLFEGSNPMIDVDSGYAVRAIRKCLRSARRSAGATASRASITPRPHGGLDGLPGGWYGTWYRKETRRPGEAPAAETVPSSQMVRDLTTHLQGEARSAETDGRTVWVSIREPNPYPCEITYTPVDTAGEFLRLALADAGITAYEEGHPSAGSYWVEIQTPAGGVIQATGRGARENEIGYRPSEHCGWIVQHIPDPEDLGTFEVLFESASRDAHTDTRDAVRSIEACLRRQRTARRVRGQ